VVKELVLEVLQQAYNAGLMSLAFPPLGVGKRFQYGRGTTAAAMVEAIQQFLQSSPNAFQVRKVFHLQLCFGCLIAMFFLFCFVLFRL
jgi:O-acetyl-ADP-ribose deacetylase (regulator of RNase III)